MIIYLLILLMKHKQLICMEKRFLIFEISFLFSTLSMDPSNHLIYQSWMHQLMCIQQRMNIFTDSAFIPNLQINYFPLSILNPNAITNHERVEENHQQRIKEDVNIEHLKATINTQVKQENELIYINCSQFSSQKSHFKNDLKNIMEKNQEKSLISPKKQEQEVRERALLQQKVKKNKYESKNIAKNYGKAIITFIERRKHFMRKVLQDYQIDQQDFLRELKRCRMQVLTMKGLRSIWINQKCKYAKQIRILSQFFLRKFWLQHVFDSRIVNHQTNLKYRQRMIEILKNPQQFTYLKQY